MNFDFELILVWAVAISGVLILIQKLFFKAHKENFIFENARSFFPILLAVLFLRSFIVEPFRIPSGSLKPTLLVGDFILVNKFDYGLRLPVWHTKLVSFHEPKRGQIVVFRYPDNPKLDYIKRIIGLPGDKIQYINKTLTINGIEMPQWGDELVSELEENGVMQQMLKKTEELNGVAHKIYHRTDVPAQDLLDIEVPTGHYFVLGDNRDESSDSRYWGFVPEANLVGKAFAIWMSWDNTRHTVRWERLASRII